MNPVTSIDPAVFSSRVNPQRQAEQAGPNRVDRKPDRVPSDPCEPPAFSEPGVPGGRTPVLGNPTWQSRPMVNSATSVPLIAHKSPEGSKARPPAT